MLYMALKLTFFFSSLMISSAWLFETLLSSFVRRSGGTKEKERERERKREQRTSRGQEEFLSPPSFDSLSSRIQHHARFLARRILGIATVMISSRARVEKNRKRGSCRERR
jgi:hypothetical protein